MRKTIQLTVNGRAERAEVEPRLQLADFLREHLALTGTHLGCEHGVCGACTVEINGAPARSCIAYTAACDGAEVRTIEGFDDDPVMAELREAFSAEHALQCGYCTPGMLVTSRDIVLRLPHADEARIREELSGNLCRCTGYVGIVRAIQRVLKKRIDAGSVPPEAQPKRSLAPATADKGGAPDLSGIAARVPGGGVRGHTLAQPVRPDGLPAAAQPKGERQTALPQNTLHQSFTVDHPRAKVWGFFGRLAEVTECLPGATVIGTPTDDHVEIRLRIKVGPIVAEFEGAADAMRDAASYSGTVNGSARDTRSSSATRGEIRYALAEERGGAATRVDVDVAFTLTGALAQFSRSSIVQDIAKRMTAAFAQNLEGRLNQLDSGATEGKPRTSELDAGSLFFPALWSRIKTFFRSLLRR